MSSSPVPPYGALIEKARDDAGMSRREAAKRAGISDTWWKYVVLGRQGETPVTGSAEVVAAMARVVGVDPQRLEEAGGRPDAAEILRENLRTEAASAPSPAGPVIAVAPVIPLSLNLDDERGVIRAITELTRPDGSGDLLDWEVGREMVRSVMNLNDRRRGSQAGLPDQLVTNMATAVNQLLT